MEEEEKKERIFSLGEASGLLPELEAILTGIKLERRLLEKIAPEIKKAFDKASHGGGSPYGPRYMKAIERILGGIEKIQEMGVLVKDLDRGLCDFPYMLDGRVVYLCWKLGEERIEWWHEVNTGYTGRQPLHPS